MSLGDSQQVTSEMVLTELLNAFCLIIRTRSARSVRETTLAELCDHIKNSLPKFFAKRLFKNAIVPIGKF